MSNPINRIIILSIVLYFSLIFGNVYLLSTIMKILDKNISISNIIWNSALIELILYIIMIISLYTIPLFFNKLYYLLFLFVAWYINLFFSSFLYYIPLFLSFNFNQYINLFLFFGIGTIITIIGMINEYNLVFDRINIKCNNLKGIIKFAHLTDLHLGAVYGKDFIQRLVNFIKTEPNIDFIVITGDIVDGNRKMTLEMLEPFSQLKMPIYYVTGNHESFTFIEETLLTIHNSSLKHICNENIIFDNKLNIIGMDWNPNFDLIKSKLYSLIPRNEYPNIFLHHVPIFKAKDLFKYNIFLFLAGHTHGGQLFPMNIVQWIVAPSFKGLYNYNDSNYVYVCSGVGTSGPPIRTMSKAMVGLITLEGTL